MATARRARTAPVPSTTVAMPLLQPRLQVEYMDINDIVPYEWNPRDNAAAVQSVASSMRLTGGFAMPVIVDARNTLIAGHTRIEAAKLLGLADAPVIRLSHLTPEQVNLFRIVDNKVSEQAKWDYELLAGEMGKLKDLGIDFLSFGWSQGEIDCLSDLVRDDCLETDRLLEREEEQNAQHQERRAPSTARFVLAEVVFFIPASTYRTWIDGVRQLCDFNEEAVVSEVKRRLGILE